MQSMTIANGLRKVRSKVAGFSLAMLVMSMFTVSVAQAGTFTDVTADNWAYPFVEKLAAEGVLNTSVTTYRPADFVQRDEMAKLVVEAFDLPLENPETPTFKDVPKLGTDGKANWSYQYVETAAKHGVVGGYSDSTGKATGYFGPADKLTREQAMKMIVLAAPLTTNTKGGPHFDDVPASAWSYEYVETGYNWMVVDGFPGTKLFKPTNNVQRDQVAKMVANAMDPQQRPGSGFMLDTADAMSATTVEVCFSEEPVSTEALDAANYMVEDLNGTELAVSSVAAGTDPMCVELTTAAQDSTKVYEVTASGITSADSGEAVMAGAVQFNGYTVGAAGALEVRVDGSTPDSMDIPKNGANILFSVFALEASDDEAVRVEQLVLTREGLGLPGDFDNVKLYVDGVQMGGEKTVNTTTNTATFNLTSSPIVVDAGSTVLVEVRGDMNGAENSQNKFCVNTSDDVTAFGETTDNELAVSGDFAACGEYMTTTSASVGTLTYKVSQPSTADVNVGDTDVIMTKLRLDAAQEDITLDRVSFKQAGSADPEDFGNPRLVVSGTALDVEGVWSGDYLTFDLTELATPVVITKGASKNFELWVDVVGGLGNDASFDIYRDWHIEGTGNVYHYGVNVEEDGASITPADRNIVGGNIAFALSAKNPITGEVADGANDHEFLRFNVSTAGDAIVVRKLTLMVTGLAGTPTAAEIEDLKIWTKKADGTLQIVAGPNDVNALAPTEIEFTDGFDVPGAATTEFIVTADIVTGTNTGDSFRVDVLNVDSSADTEIEFADGDPVDEATEVSGGTLTGNAQTVQDPSVNVTLAATPGDKTYVRNNNDKDLAAFDFQANTADDLKVTTVTVRCVAAGGGDCADAFQSLKLYMKDGSTMTALDGPRSMTDVGGGDGEVVFSFTQDVPAGNAVRLLVRGNLASAAIADNYFFDIGAGDVTVEDSEGNDATVTGLDTANRVVTIDTNGDITNQNVSDTSTIGRILIGKSTLQPVLKVRFSADELEDWYVRKMNIQNIGNCYVAGCERDADVSKIYLQYNDGVGTYTASANLINDEADFSLPSGHYVKVPANGSVTVTVLIDVGEVTNGAAGPADYPRFMFDGSDYFEAVGASSAETYVSSDVNAACGVELGCAAPGGSTNGEYMYLARSAPTVAEMNSGLSKTIGSGNKDLYKFSVKADAAGDISLKQLTFDVTVNDGVAGTLDLENFKLLRSEGSSPSADITSSNANITVLDEFGTVYEGASNNLGGGGTYTIYVVWDDGSGVGEEIITAGTTNTYTLQATVTGNTGATDESIDTILKDDGSSWCATDVDYEPVNGYIFQVDGCTSYFVWSDLSDSPHSSDAGGPSSDDWLDGTLVTGLSSVSTHSLTK